MAVALTTLGAALALALLLPALASAANFWTEHRALNITHQGGEDEAPSATMWAFERSMKLGSDMLEVDVNTTKDDKLVIIHDGTVDRTTNETGPVADRTLAQMKQLDAAYWWSPIAGYPHDGEASDYPFRGVRTGEKKPPMGYGPEDFRPLELKELMDKYPDVPINIEIKGGAVENDASYAHVADVLAAFLNKLGRTKGIAVASFNDAALAQFHDQAPQIDMAPATAAVAAYKFGMVQPPAGTKVFQVPIEFSGITVVDQAFVDRAHNDGFGVHVWTIDDEDDMNQLFDWGVDGIMSAQPMRLEKVMCERNEPRPKLPKDTGGKHCSPDVSITCEAKAKRLLLNGRKARVTVARKDDIDSRCAGEVIVGVKGSKKKKSADFDFGWDPPSEGGPDEVLAKAKLPKKLAKMIRKKDAAKVRVHIWDSFAKKQTLKLG